MCFLNSLMTSFGIVAQVREALARDRLGRLEHRLVRELGGRGGIALVELDLRFERHALGRGQAELHERDDLAGALADAHVADRVLPRVAPVAVELRVLVDGRQRSR